MARDGTMAASRSPAQDGRSCGQRHHARFVRCAAAIFDHESGAFVPDPGVHGFYEVKTWWRTIDDFTAGTKSPAFAQAHADRAPKEMFAGPSQLKIHEVLLSTDHNDRATDP
jgi:hypothetical protein